jgi:hypothetical protein
MFSATSPTALEEENDHKHHFIYLNRKQKPMKKETIPMFRIKTLTFSQRNVSEHSTQ